MLKICAICGKEFDGGPRAKVCSGPCRLEEKRRYNKEYREKHFSSIREQKAKWYAKSKGKVFVPPAETPKEEEFKVDKSKDYRGTLYICRSSVWGRRWLKKDRLEQIVSLSTELSRHNIAKLSYGQLSAMEEKERNRYNGLLEKVVKAKEGEL